jgi:hypothetical protein
MSAVNLFTAIAKVARRSAADDVRDQLVALIDDGRLNLSWRGTSASAGLSYAKLWSACRLSV